MEIDVKSSPAGFQRLLSDLDSLQDREFIEEVAEEMGDTVEDLIAKGFASATDPYGIVWPPRKLARGRRIPPHPPLDKSGDLKGSFHVEHNAGGLKVHNPVIYAPVQNYGNLAGTIDARAMLPREGEVGDWEQPLTDAAQRVFNRRMNRAA